MQTNVDNTSLTCSLDSYAKTTLQNVAKSILAFGITPVASYKERTERNKIQSRLTGKLLYTDGRILAERIRKYKENHHESDTSS